jgi:CheY-like chemotaxis protein
MNAPSEALKPHIVIIADDERDIHTVTEVSLRSLSYQGRRIEFVAAYSGAEAVEAVRANPTAAVILLDVVMENDHAGLDACRAIRNELGNDFIRILLRTGQPGVAPERTVIRDYDIDGYLPKSELTSMRLFTAVRTSIKANVELMELEWHRKTLAAIHDCAASLRSYEPIEVSLERILATAHQICPCKLAVLMLETVGVQGAPQRYFLHESEGDAVASELAAEKVRGQIAADPSLRASDKPTATGDGYLIPMKLEHGMGAGWIYLSTPEPDQLARHSLPMLSMHGINVLYATLTQAALSQQDRMSFDYVAV